MHVWVGFNLRSFTDFICAKVSSLQRYHLCVQSVRLQKRHSHSSSHVTGSIISGTCCLVIFLRYRTELLHQILVCIVWCGGSRNGAGTSCCSQHVVWFYHTGSLRQSQRLICGSWRWERYCIWTGFVLLRKRKSIFLSMWESFINLMGKSADCAAAQWVWVYLSFFCHHCLLYFLCLLSLIYQRVTSRCNKLLYYLIFNKREKRKRLIN